jgi:hypothetical protein
MKPKFFIKKKISIIFAIVIILGGSILSWYGCGKHKNPIATITTLTDKPSIAIVGNWKVVQCDYVIPPWTNATISSDRQIQVTDDIGRTYYGTYAYSNNAITYTFSRCCFQNICSPAYLSGTLSVNISGDTMIWTSEYNLTVTFIKV